MNIELPYLLFIGDAPHAKTAHGVCYWRPDACCGQLRYADAPVDLGLPDLTIAAAKELGARTLLIGAAPAGGRLPQHWIATLLEALDNGLDIANGLHTRLHDIDVIRERARALGRQLFDVRHPAEAFEIGDFARRPGSRLLTVGTDCAVGKMYAALAIEKELRRRGVDADFRATGQTGILIAGAGVSVDAVISDFVSAAAASLSPANKPSHWDIIEGQGSLFHPAYAGVTLGLVHGSQPDAMVLCSDPTRHELGDFPLYKRPGLAQCIDAYTAAARLTNPDARVVGVCLNTSAMSGPVAAKAIDDAVRETGLPCVDPVRFGIGPIVDALVPSTQIRSAV